MTEPVHTLAHQVAGSCAVAPAANPYFLGYGGLRRANEIAVDRFAAHGVDVLGFGWR
jgi:hypothetical protein